ncbi:MAG: RHS repeat-associated core domain-containing protein [Candidatus Obscuribacterales bacterium]|nr:RHS repeat-associated core domain-containing protein [Candidatus Obscuribacterales bacterium]
MTPIACRSGSKPPLSDQPRSGLGSGVFVQASIGCRQQYYRLDYVASTSAGATATISAGNNTNGNTTLTIGGSATAGNTISLSAYNPVLASGPSTASYTVQGGDTTTSIATGLKNAINANTTMQALGISSTSSASVITVKATSMGSKTLTYDENGNMTSDGVNTYSWDAENRLVQITYPGSGNNSQLVYDGLGQNVVLAEVSAGATTSTKQFVWSKGTRCEERNSSGATMAQYFEHGQMLSGVRYFFTSDHLRSTRSISDVLGVVKSDYSFDLFGRTTKTFEAAASNLKFAGYYEHERSGLNLLLFRVYNPGSGRFLSRDPLGEGVSPNPYCYVLNDPTAMTDPSGLSPLGIGVGIALLVIAGITLVAANDANTARDASRASGLAGPHNGEQDAVRHCIWSCLMSKHLGSPLAQTITNAYEFTFPNPIDERAMDQHNNRQGRQAACSGDCVQECIKRLRSGSLQTHL